jgi:precorrin-3B synthase
MLTGDGLLARIHPDDAITLNTFASLCEASWLHGNGIMEVTQRGSLQIRGLSATSAPAFADRVAELGLGAAERPKILSAPLLGLEQAEGADLRALITDLRTALPAQINVDSLDPKLSVLIDTQGSLHLDAVPADVRLRARGDSRLHLSVGGDAITATSLGWIESDRAVQAIVDLIKQIVKRGLHSRAKDLLRDLAPIRAAVVGSVEGGRPPGRSSAQPIGIHSLLSGHCALGIALPFGYTEARKLQRWVQAANDCGALSIRPAPGRTLLAIELTSEGAHRLASVACDEGFVVDGRDARRSVVACAGAPACFSAALETRRLAPLISQAAGTLLDGSMTIHVSGCAKGCAHPGVATLTVVGPDRLVVLGRAGDTPHGFVDPSTLVVALKRLRTQRQDSVDQPSSHHFLTQLGAVGVVESMGGAAAHG